MTWARIFVVRARPWAASGAQAQDAHESRSPREVVGLLWNSDPARFTVVAGWALDDDGERWRPHVWAWDGEATAIVEPSGSTRLIYLGAALSETEAAETATESPAWLSIA